jgi:Mg2+-importing ATPase
MTALVFAANALLGKGYFPSFLFAVALAVGITPEILPIVVTISLSNGALRMAKEKVIIKRLVSVEDLGNIDTLCCDKTGTLTEGELSLAGHFDLEGKQEEKLIIYGLLCNSAVTSKGKKTFGNAVDRAIWKSEKTIGHKMHIEEYKVVDLNEFDFKRRRMSVVVRRPDGSDVLISKGAPEEILEVSSSATFGGKQTPMSPDLAARIRSTVELYERDGYKVITIAEKSVTVEDTSKSDESGLNVIGFLLFIDPPKETAKASIAKLQNLGVAIKVISGDSVLVTRKICRDVGMCSDVPHVCTIHSKPSCYKAECTRVVSGEELAALSEKEFEEHVRTYGIFARVTPEQKYKIVMSLKREGHIVGFLGDGINDVPALKAADVGITVDSATGIAKEEADVILLKKSLRVLAHGIVEGRKTFGNITKYILNTISANTGNMMTVALSSLFLRFIPLLPSQILLNNFMSDLPMLTISTDKVDDELLKKPRRWNLPMIWDFMLYFGAISSFFDLLFIVPLVFFGVGEGLFRTAWFLESVLSEIIITFAVRTNRSFYKSMPSTWLLATSLLVGIGSAAVIFTDFGKEYFQFEALTPQILAFMGAILLAYFLAAEAAKKRFFKKHGM